MAAFENIRKSVGSRVLNNKRKKFFRQKSVQNFNTAKNTAIVFDAMDSENFKHIKDFRRYLEGMKIKTELLGYINKNEVPNDLLFWDNCHVLSKKDLDFFYNPKPEVAEEFISKNFDILFDLSACNYFPLEYIIKLSIAKFKTGRYTEKENDYDFMINTGENMDLVFLIEQLKIYISILNNPTNTKPIKA